MVSVDQDHAFSDHIVPYLGIGLGLFTVVSRVPRARVVCSADKQEGEVNSAIYRYKGG